MIRQVAFGSARISYVLRFAERATLLLAVHPDQTVSAVAPSGTPPELVDARVKRRAPWILKRLRRTPDLPTRTPQRRFASGASHYLYGRELRLRVRTSATEHVVIDSPYLYVHGPRVSAEATELALSNWRRELARVSLAKRLEALAPRVLGRRAKVPALRVVAMRRRWGSCSERGTISLNPLLTEHPRGCIDYVVLHELCHLKHHNHGREFERLLTRVLPDWRRWKARLEALG